MNGSLSIWQSTKRCIHLLCAEEEKEIGLVVLGKLIIEIPSRIDDEKYSSKHKGVTASIIKDYLNPN